MDNTIIVEKGLLATITTDKVLINQKEYLQDVKIVWVGQKSYMIYKNVFTNEHFAVLD